jgi:hypothetical protein
MVKEKEQNRNGKTVFTTIIVVLFVITIIPYVRAATSASASASVVTNENLNHKEQCLAGITNPEKNLDLLAA